MACDCGIEGWELINLGGSRFFVCSGCGKAYNESLAQRCRQRETEWAEQVRLYGLSPTQLIPRMGEEPNCPLFQPSEVPRSLEEWCGHELATESNDG